MHLQWLRDSIVGQFLRQFCTPSWLKYNEEYLQWQPECTFYDEKTILVEWYPEHDEENAHNWSQPKKAFILFVIGIYSFVVYMAAPIYTPGENAFIEEFGVNNAEASLGLALYVYVKRLDFLNHLWILHADPNSVWDTVPALSSLAL